MKNTTDKARGVLVGSAVSDAIGAPAQFDGPMSYDHWSEITPEELAEARKQNIEHARQRRERIEKEFGNESSKRK